MIVELQPPQFTASHRSILTVCACAILQPKHFHPCFRPQCATKPQACVCSPDSHPTLRAAYSQEIRQKVFLSRHLEGPSGDGSVNVRLWLVGCGPPLLSELNCVVARPWHPIYCNLNFIYPVPTFPGKQPSGLIYTGWPVCQVRPIV
jgi:hypothetical protein